MRPDRSQRFCITNAKYLTKKYHRCLHICGLTQKILMDETSHQQSYPVKYPDYFVGIEAIPKLTRGFVNLTI